MLSSPDLARDAARLKLTTIEPAMPFITPTSMVRDGHRLEVGWAISPLVMAGLDPTIMSCMSHRYAMTWITGTSPVMTTVGVADCSW
jgi:hypothetical protein